MTTHSDMYKRFATSVEGVDVKWREDLDMEAYQALDKDERREADELMMTRLEENDTRAAIALGQVKCRGAVAPMQRALPNASARMKVAIAVAFDELEVSPPDELIAEVIRSGDVDGAKAAMPVARELRSDVIRNVLAWACMHHPDASARRSAGSILISASGVTDDPLVWEFRPLYLPLGSEDEATRRKHFEEICDIAQIDPSLADS
ncbi:MAG TPA: hypothetical protein PKA58_04850 [Polyangium sp.]|nr:hypothetical protein [Polyangium sp.]